MMQSIDALEMSSRRACMTHSSQARKDGNDGYDPYAGLPSDSDEESMCSGEDVDPYAIVDDDGTGPRRGPEHVGSTRGSEDDEEGEESHLEEEGYVEVEVPDVSRIELR
jgi:hypothetical protein